MQLHLQPDGKSLTGEHILRLACVTAVMEHGSQEDRRNPFDKAQRIFQYVTEGASENDSKSKGNNTK